MKRLPRLLAALGLMLLGCTGSRPTVVVIGGGPAGMAAAVEAAAGARVVLVDDHERLGGTAPLSQAITAIVTAEGKAGWDAQTGGPHPARDRYVSQTQTQVLDWLAAEGLSWRPTTGTPGEPSQLHTPAGGGVALVQAMEAMVERAGVETVLGHRAVDVRKTEDFVITLADGRALEAEAVVLATGGVMGNLTEARRRMDLAGARLLRGGPSFADGSGFGLAEGLGGTVQRPMPGLLYAHASPSPMDAERALMWLRPDAGLPIDTTGVYLPWLQSPRGDTGTMLAQRPGGMAWLVVDGPTARDFSGFDWEMGQPVGVDQVVNAVGHRQPSVSRLSQALGLAADALDAFVAPSPAAVVPSRPLTGIGPVLAVPLYPVTAKGLGGVMVDVEGRVLDGQGQAIPGLFAAGELTGFGAPYGGMAWDSTMVAGAVLTGRAAGRAAVQGLGS